MRGWSGGGRTGDGVTRLENVEAEKGGGDPARQPRSPVAALPRGKLLYTATYGHADGWKRVK